MTIELIHDYFNIKEEDVEVYRAAGYLIHHAYEAEERPIRWDEYDNPIDWDTFITRDHWYAAHPDWVRNYHQSGGIWEYED